MLYKDNTHNTGTLTASPGLAFPWGTESKGLGGEMVLQGRDMETQNKKDRKTMGNRMASGEEQGEEGEEGTEGYRGEWEVEREESGL